MKLFLLLSLLSLTAGFSVAPLATRRAPISVVMGIAESAESCLEEGCSVDTVDDLIAELKEESVLLNKKAAANGDRNQQVRARRAHAHTHRRDRC